MNKAILLTIPLLLTITGCSSNLNSNEVSQTETANKIQTPPPTVQEPWVTVNSPETLGNFINRPPTHNPDLPLTFAYPESYVPYVQYQKLAQGSGYDMQILKGEKGELRIYDAILEPPATGFSGEEFDNVPSSTREDVMDRAFPKETIKKNFENKEYVIEFYYRKNDTVTKDELYKIAETIKPASQN